MLNFEGLASELLSRAREHLVEWLPGGRIVSGEYTCGDLMGGKGDSLKINIKTGKWADFSTGDKGGDLISLYAAIYGQGQGEAFKVLADRYGSRSLQKPNVQPFPPAKPASNDIIPPPLGEPAPDFIHFKYGKATASWLYKTVMGHPMYWISRYDPTEGKKQIIPWVWSALERRWINKAYPEPRPLYNLDQLVARDTKPILIVEGEKTADAAVKLLGHLYKVTTWPGGSQALSKADLGSLAGLPKILLWPDADDPGWKCMQVLAERLHVMNVADIKIIDIRSHMTNGWDLADALNEGLSAKAVLDLARPLAVSYQPPVSNDPPPYEPPSDDDSPPQSDHEPETWNQILPSHLKYQEKKVASQHAQALAKYFKGKLLFDESTESWYFYDLVWHRITDGDFERILIKTMDLVYSNGYPPAWFNGLSTFLKTLLGRSPSMNLSNTDQPDTWNTRRELFPMKNGVLNLNTKELIPHSPDLMMNWCVPYAYDPNAECPTAMEFLSNLSQGNEESEILCLYFLWCVLHGRYDLQRYLELIGKAGAGKSTYLHIAVNLVGDQNMVPTDFEQLAENKYETARLYGKRLAVISDAEPYAGSMAKFKAIIGGDLLRFEEKYIQAGTSFVFRGMMLVAGNRPIQSKEQSTAIVRRRLIVHIDKFFPDEKRDPNILEKLSREMPGLVNWLLSLDEARVVATIKGFKSPRAMLETDVIASWLEENCTFIEGMHTQIGEYERHPDGSIKNYADHLFPNFIHFLESQQEFSKVGRKTFVAKVLEILELYGYKTRRHKMNFGAVIEGLRLRDKNATTPRILSQVCDPE